MNFEELKKKRNKEYSYAEKVLGVKCLDISLGKATCSLDIKPEHHNRINTVHGGVVFSLCDQTCGTACASRGEKHATLDANIHYLRSTKDAKILTAEAEEIKYGKSICVYKVNVFDDKNVLVCYGIFTFALIK